MITPKTERLHARMEQYKTGTNKSQTHEEFGLNKRTRRINKGILTTTPSGNNIQRLKGDELNDTWI